MNWQFGKLAAAAAAGMLMLAGCSGNAAGPAAGGSLSSPANPVQGMTSQPGPSSPGPGQAAAALRTGQTALGTVVVNGQGMTVYVFDKDAANSGTSACTGPCLTLWPPVKAPAGTPRATGVTGTVGTITLPNGTRQLTLNGLPLYTYAADAKPGDTSGQGNQGFGAAWWVVGPDGLKVSSSQSPSPSPYTGQGY